MPFDKLRANGCRIEIISFLPFVVSLSNHLRYFCKRRYFCERLGCMWPIVSWNWEKGDGIMDERTELLICLDAATAANCVPCFDYYFKKASAAGVAPDEVQKAVGLANKVKTGASLLMRQSVMKITSQDWGSDPQAGSITDHPCCC
jgi:hypothetical protein